MTGIYIGNKVCTDYDAVLQSNHHGQDREHWRPFEAVISYANTEAKETIYGVPYQTSSLLAPSGGM